MPRKLTGWDLSCWHMYQPELSSGILPPNKHTHTHSPSRSELLQGGRGTRGLCRSHYTLHEARATAFAWGSSRGDLSPYCLGQKSNSPALAWPGSHRQLHQAFQAPPRIFSSTFGGGGVQKEGTTHTKPHRCLMPIGQQFTQNTGVLQASVRQCSLSLVHV